MNKLKLLLIINKKIWWKAEKIHFELYLMYLLNILLVFSGLIKIKSL